MAVSISPELYRKLKDQVLAFTNSRQRYEPGKGLRGLSDAEIAEKIGVTAEEVTEIRCIAELDALETSHFFEADAWKQERFDRKETGQDTVSDDKKTVT